MFFAKQMAREVVSNIACDDKIGSPRNLSGRRHSVKDAVPFGRRPAFSHHPAAPFSTKGAKLVASNPIPKAEA
jgi:hypothetical protein